MAYYEIYNSTYNHSNINPMIEHHYMELLRRFEKLINGTSSLISWCENVRTKQEELEPCNTLLVKKLLNHLEKSRQKEFDKFVLEAKEEYEVDIKYEGKRQEVFFKESTPLSAISALNELYNYIDMAEEELQDNIDLYYNAQNESDMSRIGFIEDIVKIKLDYYKFYQKQLGKHVNNYKLGKIKFNKYDVVKNDFKGVKGNGELNNQVEFPDIFE